MAKYLSPDEPQVTTIYRGFLLELPTSITDVTQFTSVTYQWQSSTDLGLYSDWEDLATVTKFSNYKYIQDSLYITVYYRYRYRINYTDGTYSAYSDFALPGNGGIVPDNTPVNDLDKLAGNLGTITSGYLRGVIFETNKNNPKVRMDPTGLYAISTTSTPFFLDASTGSATFSGQIALVQPFNNSTLFMDSNGIRAYMTTPVETFTTPIIVGTTPLLYDTKSGQLSLRGKINARGVSIPSFIFGTAKDDSKITWNLEATGEEQVRIVAYQFDETAQFQLSSWAATPSNVNLMTMTAYGNAAGVGGINPTAQLLLQADHYGGPFPNTGAFVQLQTNTGASTSATILSEQGFSSFVFNTLFQNGVGMQAGQYTQAVAAGTASAPAEVVINLPQPWVNAHIAFVALGWPLTTWGGLGNFNTLASQNNSSLTSGRVAFTNGTAQNAMISWISIGR